MRTRTISELAAAMVCLSGVGALPEPSLSPLSTATSVASPTSAFTDNLTIPTFAAGHQLERRDQIIPPYKYMIPPPPKGLTFCSASVHGLIDHFEVWGVNWREDVLHIGNETNGFGLEDQLRRYCTLFHWNFVMLENDPWGYEFHAWGRVPPGNHPCVESAVRNAGVEKQFEFCFAASAETMKYNYINREKKRIKKEKKRIEKEKKQRRKHHKNDK